MSGTSAARGGSTRDEILRRALDCIQVEGFKKMSMEEVAQAAGISRAAIYLHFATKEDLALAAVEAMAEACRDRLREIARGRGAARARLAAILKERVLWRIERCRVARQSLDELYSAIREPFLELKKRLGRLEAEILAEVLIEGRLGGEFAFDDAFAVAEGFVLAQSALMPFSMSAAELGDRQEIARKLELISDMCLRSISGASIRIGTVRGAHLAAEVRLRRNKNRASA